MIMYTRGRRDDPGNNTCLAEIANFFFLFFCLEDPDYVTNESGDKHQTTRLVTDGNHPSHAVRLDSSMPRTRQSQRWNYTFYIQYMTGESTGPTFVLPDRE